MKQVVIIGAGPAGLAAAHRLAIHRVATTVLEKLDCVGGLSRTIRHKGNSFDIGGHRFFTKNRLVFSWWQDTLKDDFQVTSRHSTIYYRGKFFHYPISISNVLTNLGVFASMPVCTSYLASRLFPIKDNSTFEAWVINRFGRRLYEIFFKEYTEKIWGIPCNQISAEWAAQRIKGLSLSVTIRNALAVGKADKVKTLIREFYYPPYGCGMMYEKAAQNLSQRAGNIRLNAQVLEVRHKDSHITSVICRDSQTNNLFEVEGTDFCSSMPLTELVRSLRPQAPPLVLDACDRLKYRSLLMVYLVIQSPQLFKDNWIYVHSRDVAVSRIQNYKNWSQAMVADPSTTSLGLEYFCSQADNLWQLGDQDAINLANEDLRKLGIINQEAVIDSLVLRVPDAYPVYEGNYHTNLVTIKDFISRFENLQCIGRNGMFRYNNMDHSVLTGFLAARNILGGREDIWNVNVDQSYHEELEEEDVAPFG